MADSKHDSHASQFTMREMRGQMEYSPFIRPQAPSNTGAFPRKGRVPYKVRHAPVKSTLVGIERPRK